MNTFRTNLKPILSYPCHLLGPGLSSSFFSAHHCPCQDITGSEFNNQENTKGAPVTMHNPCLKTESVTLGVRPPRQRSDQKPERSLPSEERPPILQEHSPDSRQDVFQLFCMFEIFHDKMLKNRHQKDKREDDTAVMTLLNTSSIKLTYQ